jgi:hypothetical protein
LGAKLLQFDILKKGLLTICVSFVCFVLILKLLLPSCFHIVSVLLFVHYNLKVCLKNKRKIKESFKKTDADSSGGTIGIFAIAFKGVKAL